MNGQHHGGKGSAQRSVNKEKYESNWDAIFSKKPTAQPDTETGGSPFKDEPWYEDACRDDQERVGHDD